MWREVKFSKLQWFFFCFRKISTLYAAVGGKLALLRSPPFLYHYTPINEPALYTHTHLHLATSSSSFCTKKRNRLNWGILLLLIKSLLWVETRSSGGIILDYGTIHESLLFYYQWEILLKIKEGRVIFSHTQTYSKSY